MWRTLVLHARRACGRQLEQKSQALEPRDCSPEARSTVSDWRIFQQRMLSSASEPQQESPQAAVDTLFNERSTSTVSPPVPASASNQHRKTLARLMYRAKQRGWLEMDLLVGMWAEQHLPKAEPAMLAAFEALLQEENPDLLKWLTGQQKPPEALCQNPAFRAIFKDTQKQLNEHTLDRANAMGSKEWIRGWDDWSRTDEQHNTAAAEAAGTSMPHR